MTCLNSVGNKIGFGTRLQPYQGHSDPVSFVAVENLMTWLKNEPDLRNDKLNRARKIIDSPHYPSEVLIKGIASMLAGHLKGDELEVL